MPTDPSSLDVPDELRHLGELRQVFATTAGAVANSVVRALIPLALGGGLIAVAAVWLGAGTWKYFVALGLGLLLALQGVRVLVRTMFRRNQKVLIFEKGLAIWRYGEMATFRWDQVDQVEALVAKAQGAPTSFLGFSFRGQADGGEPRTYTYHPAGDPIPNLKVLWTIIEEAAGRGRAAAAIATVTAGEEVTFQRTIWGKVVSTQIGVSLFGIRAKPRYEAARFLDWSRVEQIGLVATPTAAQWKGYTTGGIPHLEIRQTYHPDEPWVSELASEIPGYQALIEVAEFARARYAETAEQLDRDRFPAARAVVAAGEEFCLGALRRLPDRLPARHRGLLVGRTRLPAVRQGRAGGPGPGGPSVSLRFADARRPLAAADGRAGRPLRPRPGEGAGRGNPASGGARVEPEPRPSSRARSGTERGFASAVQRSQRCGGSRPKAIALWVHAAAPLTPLRRLKPPPLRARL